MGIKVPEMQWPGKRKQGRPRRSYLDVLKEDMQEVGVREDEVFWEVGVREDEVFGCDEGGHAGGRSERR